MENKKTISKINQNKSQLHIKRENTLRKKINQRRILLYVVIAILVLLSALNMYSAAFYMKPGNIKKHIFYLVLFIFIFALFGIKNTSVFSYKFFNNRKINIIIFFIAIASLLGLYLGGKIGFSFIPKINGKYRWINLGPLSLQPAELLKCAFIINMANFLSNAEQKFLDKKEIITGSLVYLFTYCGLIYLQDLGTAIHYGCIWLFMLASSKVNMKLIIQFVTIGFLATIAGVYFIYSHLPVEVASFRMMRIKSYVDGLFFGYYSDDYGYQVKQSVYGLGSGGVFGKGFANGVQKYNYLPEIHTDFVMVTFGEEFGTIGIVVILFLFFILFSISLHTSRECPDYFGKYLSLGIGSLIIIQVIVNLFVVTGLIPVTGLPMPFFSYGGSALLTLGICLGLINNINIYFLKNRARFI